MNLDFIKPQNLGSSLTKSSQSNFNLRLSGSYLFRSYPITTVNLPDIYSEYLVSLGCQSGTNFPFKKVWRLGTNLTLMVFAIFLAISMAALRSARFLARSLSKELGSLLDFLEAGVTKSITWESRKFQLWSTEKSKCWWSHTRKKMKWT